ncbi:YcnI family protein [Streptomyces sp. TRM66268-LWL]|uniref:YcnI family protein n=1 Tax=Streptomyces polyasparticus TaxID=2767826 RepID=A0ABR7SHC1_9ACTN|nr:YcnI family protein [Streptomyces polyasparticus]MBC9714130.1 YcnI family protein [Streptomyces polyasparticus]
MKISRVLTASAVAAGSVVLLSGTAFAHVSVQPQGEAAKGSYATVNFKVPNESDTASTVKVEVNFPTEHPLASAMPQPVPGWDVKVTKSKLDKPLEVHGNKIEEAVSKVTWTADDDGIKPGTFQQFPLSLGQLPEDADQMVFKALQTYSDKEVVRWIEEPVKGGEEPEKPAPVLKLSEAADDHHGGGTTADKASDSDSKAGHDDAKENTASADSSDGTARALGIAGILVGAAGVAFGVLAGRRRSA